MVTHKNECVGCGFPCIGSACPYICVDHYICDNCGSEDPDKVYTDSYGNVLGCSECIGYGFASEDSVCPECGDTDMDYIFELDNQTIGCSNCIKEVNTYEYE